MMMLARALLQTSLLLWMVQQTLQRGLKPQTVAYGRLLPNRGVPLAAGVKPGATGALGAVGNRYNTKAMKAGALGRYGGAQLGVGGYRSLGLGGRAGLKPGYGTQGGYGASLGAGMLGPGLSNGHGLGHGLGLGQAGKRVYGGGLGTGLGTGLGAGHGAGLGTGLGTGLGALPGGYGALGGMGIPGQTRQGYLGGQGNYLGGSLGAGGYGTGLGQGGYLGGAAGKMAAGYGDGMTGYLGAVGTNGYGADVRGVNPGYANGFGDGYGAALSTGAFPGQLPGNGYGSLGTGLETVNGKYGGAAALPYGGAGVIPAGLEGEAGYPYNQPLGLEAEAAKSAKSYGDQAAKFTGGTAALVNGYKG